MRLISSPLCIIFLVSCASTRTVDPVVGITSTLRPTLEPTSSFIPPAKTATLIPTITPTATPTETAVPCDPFTVDFCVTDGRFLLQRPILPPGNDSVERTYPYASTADGTRDPHHGVEFENEIGTPIHAAADGIVVFAGPDEAPVFSPWSRYYGNLIVLKHENDLFTLYAHLSKIEIRAGAAVTAGDQIGEVGRSGVAIGSHLHFEVRRGDVQDYFSTVNPELWLFPRPSFGVISLAIANANSSLQRAEITVQLYDSSNNPLDVYYLDTYHPSLVNGTENAGIGDLPAGRYRITLIFNGHLFERWAEVESGKLTQVVIVVK